MRFKYRVVWKNYYWKLSQNLVLYFYVCLCVCNTKKKKWKKKNKHLEDQNVEKN